jgi:hypothetical protein
VGETPLSPFADNFRMVIAALIGYPYLRLQWYRGPEITSGLRSRTARHGRRDHYFQTTVRVDYPSGKRACVRGLS